MSRIALRIQCLWLLPLGMAACTIRLPEGAGQPARADDPAPPASETCPAQPCTAPPPPLDYFIATGDNADRVRVVSRDITHGRGGQVMLCLELHGITWWKGLGIGRSEPTLTVWDRNVGDCTPVDPAMINVTFWKAKMFGVHTRIGTASLDLRPYAGHQVTLQWSAD